MMEQKSDKPISHLINEIREDRRDIESEMRNISPVYAEQVKLMARVYGEKENEGGLSQIHRILIALGMAVHSGRESSIDWTITRAFNHGATEQMIRETIDVALLNGGTFTVANARFAFRALQDALQRGVPKS
jgi:alkylhydroperoxidase/carboxymuconolactone decarboxylase family protein YurZ